MILVTGGAGYIGSHACIEFLNENHEIIVLDNLSNSKRDSLDRVKKITGKDFKFYEIDLLNRERLETVFVENSIKSVVHFAGLKAVGESVDKPMKYYQNNITGTLNLCELMEKYGVYNLVFSSSATVYGKPERMPISEDAHLDASSPYGRTKLMIEELLKDIAISNEKWSVVLLRYFNPIGAHKSGLIGEDPNGIPNNLMPYISQVAVGKLHELAVYGDDYQTVDGTGVRDYIHVVDLANGHLKALEYVVNHNGVEAYNLGTGNGYSVLEVIKAFERVSNTVIPYKICERRSGDIAICYADPSRSKQMLGWEASRGINEMCSDTWLWQQMNPDGYKSS